MIQKTKTCALIALALLLLFCGLARAGESDLVWSTFLGGSDDDVGVEIAMNSSGYTYIAGSTFSSDFPITAGSFDTSYNGQADVFVAKLTPTGNALVYATFLGGANDDWGNAPAVDDVDNAYVTGWTSSADFPTTAGAFDTSHNGSYDAFVIMLTPTGSVLSYSTFLGGGSYEWGSSIAVGSSGNTYLTGMTSSSDFPTTDGAFDTTLNGDDVFVVKLNSTGSALDYSTFLGGGYDDYGYGIVIESTGNAYVTGETYSTDFPITAGAFDTTHNGGTDAFVTKLNSIGNALDYCTFLGGSLTIEVMALVWMVWAMPT